MRLRSAGITILCVVALGRGVFAHPVRPAPSTAERTAGPMTDEKPPTRRRNTLHDIFAAARDERLTPEELRVWLLYRYHDFEDNGTFVGAARVGREAGMAERTVERHRSSLVGKGFLQRKLRGPRPAVYRAIVPPKDYADVAEHEGEEEEKHTHETTQICVSEPTQICHPNTGGGDTVGILRSSNELRAEQPSAVQPRDSFWDAIGERDQEGLFTLVEDHLSGFTPEDARWIVSLADKLVEVLEDMGHQPAADGVGAVGSEDEVLADAIRDMSRKGYTGRWDRQVFMHFVVSAAQIRTGLAA